VENTAYTAELAPGYGPDTRVVSGLGLLNIDDLDKRTKTYKRYESIRRSVLSDRGGEQNVSEVQRQLISKFATLALQLELQEAAALAGEPIDVDLFGRCAGHLRRLAESLGVDRVPRNITPTVQDYVANLNTREAAR
jgi:hypothetical protein